MPKRKQSNNSTVRQQVRFAARRAGHTRTHALAHFDVARPKELGTVIHGGSRLLILLQITCQLIVELKMLFDALPVVFSARGPLLRVLR